MTTNTQSKTAHFIAGFVEALFGFFRMVLLLLGGMSLIALGAIGYWAYEHLGVVSSTIDVTLPIVQIVLK